MGRAESYGMKIATLGGLMGISVPIQFVVKKPSDSDDVNVVKAVIEAMLISVPRMRMKMGDVKKHLGSKMKNIFTKRTMSLSGVWGKEGLL